MCVYHMHAVPAEVRRGHYFPGIRVTGGYELPYGGWEPNPDLLQKLQVILSTEATLQPTDPSSTLTSP